MTTSLSTKSPLIEESFLETLYPDTQTVGQYFSGELILFSENTSTYLHSWSVISALYLLQILGVFAIDFDLKTKVVSLRNKHQI